MNRIILAYAPENAALANTIDQQLSRIGIPFEHANQSVAAQINAASEPVLLLVTDNFLINRACLEGLLPVLKGLAADKRLVAVLADGVNASGQAVPTHIDRMANALHYMQHWQDAWLALSDQHQKMEAAEKVALTPELDAMRGIANEVGDIISTLRDAGYLTWQQFEANGFELFFQKFNLQDWHGQYKHYVAQVAESHILADSPHLPEVPVLGGLLTPEPMPEPELAPLVTMQEPVVPTLSAMEDLTALMDTEKGKVEVKFAEAEKGSTTLEEQQAARDAWFWIEKGHAERGLELFLSALEQYPNSEWLKAEYERAAQPPSHSTPIEAPDPALSPSTQTDEAKSYELMGDMAAERGDYLFAKYCWDRVVEMDPTIPNIYRKLGLMTAEHLRDYRETAAIYLRKSLEANANDPAVKAALGEITGFGAPMPIVESRDNTLQSLPEDETPASVLPADALDLASEATSQQELEALHPSTAPPLHPPPSPLVLITGATSGIGKATAEIFARNGYRLILTGRRVERLVELKNRFEAEFGTEVLLLPFDVRDSGAVEAALANLPESFQDIDILVNNAGLAKGLAPIHEGNLEHWETMIDTNVKGLLYVTRQVSPGMVRRRQGHIINVGSSAGKETYPKGNVYCATKFAVDALSKAMRFDLHVHNIRVSQVSPGHVEETEFALTRFDGDADRAKIYNDFQPLKSSDVADAIYFMATRPAHVNIQDLQLFATQQASSTVIDRSGR